MEMENKKDKSSMEDVERRDENMQKKDKETPLQPDRNRKLEKEQAALKNSSARGSCCSDSKK
jgi:hypothetical protein